MAAFWPKTAIAQACSLRRSTPLYSSYRHLTTGRSGPCVTFDHYRWRPSPDDPGVFERPLGGAELFEYICHTFKKQDQIVFFALNVELSQGQSREGLLSLIRRAWTSLRYAIPTIAAHTKAVQNGTPLPTVYLTYAAPGSQNEADVWADNTVRFIEDVKDLKELRYALGSNSIPEPNGDQTFLYVVQFSPTSFGLLLHTSHVVMDGSSRRIFITQLINRVSSYISSTNPAALELFEWGKEVKNLVPFAQTVLGPKESREWPEYFQTLADVMSGTSTGVQRAQGFNALLPASDGSVAPVTRHISHRFSADETKDILAAVKLASAESGVRLTFNHIAHAALSLVTIHDNPPDSADTDKVIFFYGLVNGRSRLAEPYNSPQAYPALCLATSAIQVPVSKAFPLTRPIKEQIVDLSVVLQEEYEKQKAYPSLMAIGPAQVEFMLNTPPTPPWLGPWYAGDGKGEDYLQRDYKDAEGETAITITDYFSSVNKFDPEPAFRAWSWNGKIRLSCDINVNAIDETKVSQWMSKWVEFLSDFARGYPAR